MVKDMLLVHDWLQILDLVGDLLENLLLVYLLAARPSHLVREAKKRSRGHETKLTFILLYIKKKK